MQESGPQQPTAESVDAAPPEGNRPEQELIVRLRRGGQAALASEFLRHRHRLHRMIEVRLDRRLAGRVDPSEVLEEAFLEAVRRLDQYLAQPPMPIFLWLRYLIGQRILALHERLLGLRPEEQPCQDKAERSVCRLQVDSASLSKHLAAQLSRHPQVASSQDLSHRLEQMLQQLDPLDREILALRHFEQLTNQEAAEELGLSPAIASHRYIQALEKLGALLKSSNTSAK